jgi:hypothetical protein
VIESGKKDVLNIVIRKKNVKGLETHVSVTGVRIPIFSIVVYGFIMALSLCLSKKKYVEYCDKKKM